MNSENYIRVVERLNCEIADICEEVYNQGVCFEYRTNYYVDLINFMGINVWNSEIDLSVETEEEVENIIREKVLKITNGLCTWQKYDGF